MEALEAALTEVGQRPQCLCNVSLDDLLVQLPSCTMNNDFLRCFVRLFHAVGW
jgi:hypothetical protein